MANFLGAPNTRAIPPSHVLVKPKSQIDEEVQETYMLTPILVIEFMASISKSRVFECDPLPGTLEKAVTVS